MLIKVFVLSTIAITFSVAVLTFATTKDSQSKAGRKVKVAAICIGTGGNYDEKVKQAVDYLNIAGEYGVDIACLPEEFAGLNGESIPGTTTDAIAKLAQKYNM